MGAYGWASPFQPPIPFRAASRPLLEHCVRLRARELEKVKVLAGRQVAGLLTSSGNGRVTGVLHEHAGGGGEERLEADLVVDASGRGSRAPAWLERMGRTPPRESVVDAFVGYSTRIYEDIPPLRDGWRSVFVLWAPPITRGGVVFPIEGGRAYVTLAGVGRDYPPTDEAGFTAFAGTLRSPHVHEAISRARPVTDIHATRSTANRWLHYERLKDLPAGLVVLGDAVCAFNPIYGQGMTVAVLGAELLGRLAKRPIPAGKLPLQFQQGLAELVGQVWTMSTSEDFRFSTTQGKVPVGTRISHRYFNALLQLCSTDVDATRTVVRVVQLLDPPGLLLRPGIALRALAHSIRAG